MRRCIAAAALALSVGIAAQAAGAERFDYAGVSLATTPAQLKQAFPRSAFEGSTLLVSDADARDNVRAIERFEEQGRRSVRFDFQRPAAAGRDAARRGAARFPKCKAIEAELRARYGAPAETVRAPGPPPRADRVWRGARETLTLGCFAGPDGESLADAVTIRAR